MLCKIFLLVYELDTAYLKLKSAVFIQQQTLKLKAFKQKKNQMLILNPFYAWLFKIKSLSQ